MPSFVVTGANRGLGFAFIQKLSADPSNTVFALTRNKATSTDLLELQSKLNNIRVLQADITDVPSLRNVAEEVQKATGGTLDVLINNGALLTSERSYWTIDQYDGKEDLLDEDFLNFYKINTLGVIKTINVFLPLLRKSAQNTLARVITIGSATAALDFTEKTGIDYVVPYSAAKAAVNMANAKYAVRFKDENILFLSISPGMSNTMTQEASAQVEDVYLRLVKSMQAGYPDWNGQMSTPEEAVTAMLNTSFKLTAKDSGAFLSHYGDTKWL